ncbi:hypothetical protein ACFXHK_23795, partial [Embleya sp. NPDC059267]
MSLKHADNLRGRTAIAGIGATEFSKESGRSELRLAVEAVGAALDDVRDRTGHRRGRSGAAHAVCAPVRARSPAARQCSP